MITTAPGEEGQVDYGERADGARPETGKYRRTRLFVLTLGYSRKARAAADVAVERADLGRAARARVSPAGRHGPASIVLDNLREGVLTPDIYDPALNPLYRDVLAHYGVVALPCRVGDPDRKGKVEAGRRPRAEDAAAGPALRDARGGAGVSRSLGDALGRHAHPRHDEAPGRRDVCRGAAGARAAARSSRFATTASATRTVHLDGCVEVEAAYYGAPPGWIGQRVARAVERPARPAARSEDRPAAARASARAARLASHRRRRSPDAHAADDARRCSARADTRRRARSAPSASTSTRTTARTASAKSSACSRWPRNTAPPSSRTPRRPRSTSACPRIASCGATSSAGRRCR